MTNPRRLTLTVLESALQPHPIGEDLWSSPLTRENLTAEANRWIGTHIPEWEGKESGDGTTWILVTNDEYSSGDVTHVREIRTVALNDSGRYALV